MEVVGTCMQFSAPLCGTSTKFVVSSLQDTKPSHKLVTNMPSWILSRTISESTINKQGIQ